MHSTTMQIDASWYTQTTPVPLRLAAGAIVLRWAGTRLKVALSVDWELGQAAFYLPKGGVERGETLEQTAEREILEEVGLKDLEPLSKGVYALEQRYGLHKEVWCHNHFFVYRTGQMKGVPSDPRHTLHWADLERLPSLLWPGQQRLLEAQRDDLRALARRG